MAKFVAKQPVSNLVLQGLGILANPRGVRFDDIEKSGFTAQSTNIRLEIEGKGFKSTFLGAGQPKAVGTVTDIKYFLNGTLIYKLNDAKYAFKDLASSNDSVTHTEKIFAKDDVIKGSYGNDTLYGYQGSDRMEGKEGADRLEGGSGKDILSGGDGYDVLNGGKGKDTYVFKSDPVLGWDTIEKYEKNEEIHLKAKYFPGLEEGELLAEQFSISGTQTADQRIMYNSNTGYLTFDADGTGPLAAVFVARLQVGLTHLGADDFLIF